MKIKLLLLNLLICCFTLAQLPNTDVWLFKLQTSKQITIIKSAKNITNREGYDNQPGFSNDAKKIYFVSIKQDKQADIYYYDLGKEKIVQLTKTEESEYSPTLTPDDKSIACVTVLKDSAQVILPLSIKEGTISEYPIVSSKGDNWLSISKFDSAGYFTFLNADTVIYYKLTQPHSLRYYCISTNIDKWLGYNPVRGFKAINRHTLIYGLKDSTKVTFYKYDFVLHKSEKYSEYNSLNEDIIWHNEWGLLKSEGAKILRYNEATSIWSVLFDLSTYGLKKITRFNFDNKNNYLVVVDNL